MEMVERLDAFPDGPWQVQEIFAHYEGVSDRRDNDRILELWPQAFNPHNEGKDKAMADLDEMLEKRAKRKGVALTDRKAWKDKELKRIKATENG